MNRRKICIEPLKTEEEYAECRGDRKKLGKVSANATSAESFSHRSRSKHNQAAHYVLKDISGRVNSLQDYNSISTTSSNPKSKDLHSQYDQNQAKIEKLREKLGQLYNHYKRQKESLLDMQYKIGKVSKLRQQNASLSDEIDRIKNMVKEALLDREKDRLTARKG